MKILQINKYFRPKGGAESYLFDLIDLLKNNGQEILVFSQNHPDNLKSNQAEYFLTDLDLSHFNWPMVLKLGRLFWSLRAKKQIEKLILTNKPDLVHIHNIYHQISPSILPVIKKYHLPIIMTVHDFKLIKPDYTLRVDGKPNKTNLLTRLILNLEFNLHKRLKTYQKHIDLFIAPSEFVKHQLQKNGFDPDKIIVIPHFINLEKYPVSNKTENYLLSAGRLDDSKGFDVLINALKQADLPGLKLKIAGRGPAEKSLKQLVKSLNLENQVEFTGFLTKKNLKRLMADSLAVICPSRVHETFGLSVLEAFALAKPVIASHVGAYPELIKPNQTGQLFETDNIAELAGRIKQVYNNKYQAKQIGENGLKLAKTFTPEQHYQNIISAYQQLTDAK